MRLPGVCAVLRLAVRSEAPPRHGVSRRGLEPLAAGHLDLQLVDPVGEARLARDLSRHAIAGGVNHDPDLPRATSAASAWFRSEEHTSELQSLMRISYAVFCLKKKRV